MYIDVVATHKMFEMKFYYYRASIAGRFSQVVEIGVERSKKRTLSVRESSYGVIYQSKRAGG